MASNANPALLISRMAGLITSGPSILLAINVLNSVLQRYRGSPLQVVILGCGTLSIATDVLILVAVGSWIVSPSFPGWVGCVLAINILKRLHSVVTAYLAYLRMTAIVRPLTSLKRFVVPYTVLYAVCGVVSVACQFDAYASSGWNAARARVTPSFQVGYRVFNLICVLLYAVPAIGTDIYFFLVTGRSTNMAKRFDAIKQFFNPNVFSFLELVLLFSVCIPLILGMAFPDQEWTSPTYTENCLLSTIALNATMTVKAAVLMPGEISGSTEGHHTTSGRTGASTTRGGLGSTNTLAAKSALTASSVAVLASATALSPIKTDRPALSRSPSTSGPSPSPSPSAASPGGRCGSSG
ncbi:hypothetical protein H9P43_008376 [Blastocladiella emersonii ATCC 22665]|nr:hypothetical protein H9P43_008376 [Blastocladiella emersonii ATCC 22665]